MIYVHFFPEVYEWQEQCYSWVKGKGLDISFSNNINELCTLLLDITNWWNIICNIWTGASNLEGLETVLREWGILIQDFNSSTVSHVYKLYLGCAQRAEAEVDETQR